MPRPITISPSQLTSMGCRLRWFWDYKKGYRARQPNINLWFGIGIHEALEAYYDPKRQEDPVEAFLAWADKEIDQADPIWVDAAQEMLQHRELGRAMLKGYLEEYDGKDDFDVIEVEKTIQARLLDPQTGDPSPYTLTARLDGLVRDHKTGRLFSLEHKTYRNTTSEKFLNIDHQMTAQVALGQHLAGTMGLDEEVVGVLYNGLRKAQPGPRASKVPFFHREKFFRTERQIDVFLHRAFWQIHEFSQPDFPIYPQPDAQRCGWCDFAEPCHAYQTGGDYQVILDETFRSRDERSRSSSR